jgi:adenylylsulfate kinase
MAKRILIMGLPGSGKTTLARQVWLELERRALSVVWINADKIREFYKDWDFSHEGRMRQTKRLLKHAQDANADIAVVDFIAALDEQRELFGADFAIWMNTISAGRFADTNAAYETPDKYDIEITSWDTIDVKQIVDTIHGSI